MNTVLRVIRNFPVNDSKVHNVTCEGCGSSEFKCDRYKCLECSSYDLCAYCFEQRKQTKTHTSGHAVVHYKCPDELFGGRFKNDSEVTLENLKYAFRDQIHETVPCEGCLTSSITGLRFKCDICPDYDLCEQCVHNRITTKQHKLYHPVILIEKQQIPEISKDDIELGEELGHGAFGCVFKGRWLSSKRTVACKVITIPSSTQFSERKRSFFKELAAYTELSGAYILKIYGYVHQQAVHGKGEKYMLIMEYMAKGSLRTVITEGDKISLRRKLHMACNVANGIRKIHEHDMIHRDIRPDNILVADDYTAKIGDMGIARVLSEDSRHTIVGPESFMPREFYSGIYDQKLDIFTFGLTMNYLFSETMHEYQQREIVIKTRSPIFWDLISRCIHIDPKQRPTSAEIVKALELHNQSFVELINKYPIYMKLPLNEKDDMFIKFYEKTHLQATPTPIIDRHNSSPDVRIRASANVKTRASRKLKSKDFCRIH
ncbi:unnamed protein product [Didymodactylos carnosus]|uniref:Uncharacterized protein n=1 Tax=Didymodactylos carnosus TaxID=1234261 RepID=A0A814DBE5_9BILA|nr:unnamed protein product [Didymodactylos carnosus]CAF0951973.1 unnamed protein product [Didymodactylos carnosus]CAF3647187.1 unnamed protein product [Didymodactylos carnosus]CAF3727592.1 unnamed protein product [Didymodactylos carnosus]